MLKNIYTTKMSANKKQLQTRFSKICSSSGKLSRILSLIMAFIISMAFVSATVVIAAVVNEDNKIIVKCNDEVIKLNNKPFIYDNAVYVPLRELFEKVGLLDCDNTYINWNNGKIEMVLTEKNVNSDIENSEIRYLSYSYGIEIGKMEYTLNPGFEKMYQQKWNISNKKQMSHSPILKNGVTYIPFEFVEYLVNRSMTSLHISYTN